MEPFVDFSESRPTDVRVDLGGGDIGMSEHELQGTEVRPMLQEMGGKGVTNGVRSNAPMDPGLPRIRSDRLPEALPRQASTPASHEEKRGISCSCQRRPAPAEIL